MGTRVRAAHHGLRKTGEGVFEFLIVVIVSRLRLLFSL